MSTRIMKLHGYEVEILVDDKPLKEYYVPIVNGVVSTTGPSYVLDAATGRKVLSPIVTYASVARPNTRFAIKIVAHDAKPENHILAEIYIDGMTDHRWKHIKTANSRKKEFFRSSDRTRKCYFKFTDRMIKETSKRRSIDNFSDCEDSSSKYGTMSTSRTISSSGSSPRCSMNVKRGEPLPEMNEEEIKDSGGLGAISVYFYRAKIERIPEETSE
ncbi:5707_t:CDS:2, partial [Acaulospora colombiana]